MPNKRVVKKKVGKKKVARHMAPGSAGLPTRPRPSPPREPITIGTIFTLLVGLALFGAVIFLFLPRDISQLGGYPFNPATAPNPPVNLLREAQDMLVAGEGSLEISEAELNTYLNQRLRRTQGGFLASIVSMGGIYLDLQPRTAVVYVERRILGIPFIVSSTWDFFLSDGSYIIECSSSSVGRIKFSGAMFRPIMMPFTQLAKACSRERELVQYEGVASIALLDDQLVIRFRGKDS